MSQELSHVGMSRCFLCGGAKDVLLDRRLRNTFPSHPILIDLAPCQKCEELMKQGIMFIEFDDSKTGGVVSLPDGKGRMVETKTPNFHRTGVMCVVRVEAVQRIAMEMERDGHIDSAHVMRQALTKRVMFADIGTFNALGLRAQIEKKEAAP